MEKIRNLTPHPVIIIQQDGDKIEIQSEGVVRLKVEIKPAGTIAGIPLVENIFGQPEGLPEPKAGTWLIVSQIVKSALPDRNDLLVPAEVMRDNSGNIIGCRSLSI